MPIFGETSITKLNVDELDLTATVNNGARKYLLDLIYPIGSIYIYQGTTQVNNCPIASTLGGTWTQIENRFLYATASKADLGKTGGSNNAWFVGHRHYTYNFGYNNSERPNDYDQCIRLDLAHDHTLEIINLPIYSYKDSEVWVPKVNDSILTPKTLKTNTTYLKGEIDLTHRRLRGLSGTDVGDTIRTNNDPIQKEGVLDLLTTDEEMQEANMPRYTCVLAWKRTE